MFFQFQITVICDNCDGAMVSFVITFLALFVCIFEKKRVTLCLYKLIRASQARLAQETGGARRRQRKNGTNIQVGPRQGHGGRTQGRRTG